MTGDVRLECGDGIDEGVLPKKSGDGEVSAGDVRPINES